ncbi:MAG: 2-oxo acid dehydrogenase subunit E2 [Rhodothalassiaceae bacterium]
MIRAFRLQDPGEGIHEVEVREITVAVGDHVHDGDTAFVVESDKAAIELPSPYDGQVADIAVKVGDIVRVGDVLMTVETGSDSHEASDGPDAQDSAEEPKATAPAPEPASASGKEKDVPTPSRRVILAAPTARKRAKALGIDLADVTPTGRNGHVTRADVERHHAATKAAPRPAASAALPDFSVFGPVRREALRSIRKATAHHMARAWAEIPHAMIADRLDLTRLERHRRYHAEDVARAGGRLSMTVFVLHALVKTLRAHPRFNASIDMARGEIIEKDYIHIGVALDSERGLIVPVMRDIEGLSVPELAKALKALSDRVRSGQASREDLSGSSFTLTNVGALGGTGFFPIINHPEVAIMGMGRGSIEPVIIGGLDHYHVEARYILPVSLSFDHRVNDGADAARFLATFRAIMSDPMHFVIE